MSFPKPKGVWELVGSEPTLYTNEPAKIIKDLQTGKEYIRGERRVFWDEKDVPKTIEQTDPARWKFIYEDGYEPSKIDYVREIWTNGLFRK